MRAVPHCTMARVEGMEKTRKMNLAVVRETAAEEKRALWLGRLERHPAEGEPARRDLRIGGTSH